MSTITRPAPGSAEELLLERLLNRIARFDRLADDTGLDAYDRLADKARADYERFRRAIARRADR